MPIKRFICTDIQPTSSEKLLHLKQGLKRDFNGAWLSRESIYRISAMEGYNVWNISIWQEYMGTTQTSFETVWKTLKERSEQRIYDCCFPLIAGKIKIQAGFFTAQRLEG